MSVVNGCTGHVGHSRSVLVERSFCAELRLLIEAETLEICLRMFHAVSCEGI